MYQTTCIVCENVIEYRFASQKPKVCSKPCQRVRQGHFKGKLRPDHSAKMKDIIASGENAALNDSLMKPGVCRNKEVNTPAFKRKCLDSANIEHDSESLSKVYNSYQSKKLNNVHVYRTKIENAIARYPENALTQFLKTCAKWSDEELERRYFSDIHGIFTCFNFETRGKVKIHVECTKGIVGVRSTYEKNYIRLFDDMGIGWEYEPAWFRLSSGKVYLPDFKITINNENVWVEVKGAFWGNQQEETYMRDTVGPFKEFIKPEKFVLTFTEFPSKETLLGEIDAQN